MWGEPGALEMLFEMKRDIRSGLLELTFMEEAVTRSLQTIFPQHSKLGLSAVVALHSQRYDHSLDTLMTECMEFLLDKDGDYLEDFLHPSALDKDPDTSDKGGASSGTGETSLSSSVGLSHVTPAEVTVSIGSLDLATDRVSSLVSACLPASTEISRVSLPSPVAVNNASLSTLRCAAEASSMAPGERTTPVATESSPTLSFVTSSLPFSAEFQIGKEGGFTGESESWRCGDSQKSGKGNITDELDDSSRDSLPDVDFLPKLPCSSHGLMDTSDISTNDSTGNEPLSNTETCESRISSNKSSVNRNGKYKRTNRASVLEDSPEEGWSVSSNVNLPLLSPPKKKRWSILDSDKLGTRKGSPSAPSSSSHFDLGAISGSVSNSSSVYLGKRCVYDSSTKNLSQEVASAGCRSLKYLGKKSFTSSSVTIPSFPDLEVASVSSSGVTSFGKHSSSETDCLIETASHNCPSTSINDMIDSGKKSPQSSSMIDSGKKSLQSSMTRSSSHDIPSANGSGVESLDRKSANSSSTNLYSCPRLFSSSTAHVGTFDSLGESAELSFPVKEQESSTQVKSMITAPSASATSGPPVPDTRSDTQKRIDTLDARIQGLCASVDSFSAGLHAQIPQIKLPSTHDPTVQQYITEHQNVTNINWPTVAVSSFSKTIVTHSCHSDQSEHCVFDSAADFVQPTTSGVTILTHSPNNLVKESQLVEMKATAQERHSNKAHPTPVPTVFSGSVNSTPQHKSSFTAFRDFFDDEIAVTTESDSQFNSHLSTVATPFVNLPSGKQAQPDLKKHKVNIKPSMLNVQSGSAMQQLVPTVQQPRPVLQQPKLILQQPDSIPQQPKPRIQPAKLGLQQHEPVMQPCELHVEQPELTIRQVQTNMPLAQQVLFKRQSSQHSQQQPQQPPQDQVPQPQQDQVLQPQHDQVFEPYPAHVDPAPVLQDRREEAVVITGTVLVNDVVIEDYAPRQENPVGTVPANDISIEDYALRQVHPVGTDFANSIVIEDSAAPQLDHVDFLPANDIVIDDNIPPQVNPGGIDIADEIAIEDYAAPQLDPVGILPADDIVIGDYISPQLDLVDLINPTNTIVFDNTPVHVDPVPQPSTSAPVAHLGRPGAHPGLSFGVDRVLEVFPAADRGYVRQLLEHFLAVSGLDQALNQTMEHLLENPPPEPEEPEVTVVQMENFSTSTRGRDYYKQYDTACSYSVTEAADRLSMEFRNVRLETIHSALNHYNYHYAPAYRCLSHALEAAVAKHQEECKESAVKCKKPSSKRLATITLNFNEGESMPFHLMKGLRAYNKKKMLVFNSDLNAEIQFVAQQSKLDKEELDRKVAWALLESEYEEQGQSIECGCCFAEHPFENLVQCFDGHLFCCQCLQGYAREAIFGSGKLNLSCMTADCDSTFPQSQLVKALSDDDMQKYEERMTEENLNKAAMEDLVRCPSCNIAVVLDRHVQHFKCPNSVCRKETCRDCKQDWSDHKGKTCDQVEQKDETKLRTDYEEKMTAARVRTCGSCHAQFTKEEGCNKMTCRCGATMCYICRKHQISYMHFCRHPRDPGMDCTSCKKCSLWSNPEEDEKRAIAEIQKEAQEKRKAQGFLDEKLIGAPDEPASKKLRL